MHGNHLAHTPPVRYPTLTLRATTRKPTLSRYTPPTMNIPEFVAKWKSSTLTERASAQSWLKNLRGMLGQVHRDGSWIEGERGLSVLRSKEGPDQRACHSPDILY